MREITERINNSNQVREVDRKHKDYTSRAGTQFMQISCPQPKAHTLEFDEQVCVCVQSSFFSVANHPKCPRVVYFSNFQKQKSFEMNARNRSSFRADRTKKRSTTSDAETIGKQR